MKNIDKSNEAQICKLMDLQFTRLNKMSRGMRFPTMLYVQQAKPQSYSLIRAFASRLNILWLLSY